MELSEIVDLEKRLVKSIKHNCLMCHARRNFERPENPEKEIVLASLDALSSAYEDKYNVLRKGDSSVARITAAKENKRLSLDALAECRICDRQVDRANRHMVELK
ncbi:Uncharacterised protein [uncultured archaeon]|nr:Uncharacterised protein [uncultured archaeon]